MCDTEVRLFFSSFCILRYTSNGANNKVSEQYTQSGIKYTELHVRGRSREELWKTITIFILLSTFL